MNRKLHLTLATGDYESIRALKEGTVRADGIELTVLTDMTSDTRHWRMLRNREFDIAELSMSNYLMAKYIGLPFTAIPVFLHRRFRHGFIFLNTSKGIRKPADLIGRRIGLRNFQATANLWIRGILEHEHGLPHRSVHWFKQDEEEVDWTPPADLDIQRIAPGGSVEKMLLEGDLDALIHPEIIQPILDKDQRVSRLFPHYRELEIDPYPGPPSTAMIVPSAGRSRSEGSRTANVIGIVPSEAASPACFSAGYASPVSAASSSASSAVSTRRRSAGTTSPL